MYQARHPTKQPHDGLAAMRGRMVRLDESDHEAQPVSSKKQQKVKNKKGKKLRADNGIPASAQQDDDEDELGDGAFSAQFGSARGLRPNGSRMVKDLGAAACYLSSLREKGELEEFLAVNGLDSDQNVQELAEQCGNIARLLRVETAHYKSHAPATVPGAVETFDMLYVLRDGTNGFTLLAPMMEDFQADRSIKDKVVGFIRETGKYWPLMFALSGQQNCVPDHPKMLDSELWVPLIMWWGTNIGHNFPSNGWDAAHGVPKGTYSASHVEPKLMLWYACMVFRQYMGIDISLTKQLWRLPELSSMPNQIQLDIVQDRPPCKSCRRVRRKIEKFTGGKLKFTFIILPNVAVMESVYNKHGARVNLLPEAEEIDDFLEPEEQGLCIEPSRSTLQVVIKEKTTGSTSSTTTTSTTSKRNQPSTQTAGSIRVSKNNVKPTAKKNLKESSELTLRQSKSQASNTRNDVEMVRKTTSITERFTFAGTDATPRTSTKVINLIDDEDDDEQSSDWESQHQQSKTKKQTLPKTLISSRSVNRDLPTPANSPLGLEARRHAEKLKEKKKKKRSHDLEASPSAAKKSRRNKYD